MLRHPVSLRPAVGEDNDTIRKIKVKPFQQMFSGQTSDFVDKIEDGMSMHVIEQEGQIVGVFRMDKQFQYGFTFASFDTPGIGDFIVDEESQAKGIGTEACRLMPNYLRQFVPRARGVYFLVHVKNVGALKAFIRGGCVDTNEQYARGPTGPQHILWMGF